MALFGAPIAHEDHARRACYAALHLQEALRRYANELRLSRGLNFAVRMGLNSGEVVVGTIGDDLRMDYTAQGYVVGLAARMEQIAAPDHAYLTEHTAHLVTGFFRLAEPLGSLTPDHRSSRFHTSTASRRISARRRSPSRIRNLMGGAHAARREEERGSRNLILPMQVAVDLGFA